MITVAPFPWQLVCLSSKQQNVVSFAHFFPFRLPRKTNCKGKLAKCNYDFWAWERISLSHLPTRTTRYFIIIRETPRSELLTKTPVITLYQQRNQSAGGNNLYFPVFDIHYVISMVSYRPKYTTNERARNRSVIEKIVNQSVDCNMEVKGIIFV